MEYWIYIQLDIISSTWIWYKNCIIHVIVLKFFQIWLLLVVYIDATCNIISFMITHMYIDITSDILLHMQIL